MNILSQEELQVAIEQACQWIKQEIVASPQQIGINFFSSPRQLRIVSREHLNIFIHWFSFTIQTDPSAENVVFRFACAVLSIIGNSESLTEWQGLSVLGLCKAITQRPLPAVIWADFVASQLDTPQIVSQFLAIVIRHSLSLNQRLPEAMRRSYPMLNLTAGKSIFVTGYSSAIVAALRGLPEQLFRNTTIVTPAQLLPNRLFPGDRLLRESLLDIDHFEVVTPEDALDLLKRGHFDLLMMGCKVIGLNQRQEVEIINSSQSYHYTRLAYQIHTPTIVVGGAYNLWPTQTYEKYLPNILGTTKYRNSQYNLVDGKLISWILTEDGLYSPDEFIRKYKILFDDADIPLTAIRYSLIKVNEDLRDSLTKIGKLVKDPRVFNALTVIDQLVSSNDKDILAEPNKRNENEQEKDHSAKNRFLSECNEESLKGHNQSEPRKPRLKIFLCHASEDQDTVRKLYIRLKNDQIDPWFSRENILPGQDWEQEVRKAVRAADVILVCLSRKSIPKVGYVQREIKFALEIAEEQPSGTIFIIPLKMEECDLPAHLQRWQSANFFEEEGYERLLQALKERANTLYEYMKSLG